MNNNKSSFFPKTLQNSNSWLIRPKCKHFCLDWINSSKVIGHKYKTGTHNNSDKACIECIIFILSAWFWFLGFMIVLSIGIVFDVFLFNNIIIMQSAVIRSGWTYWTFECNLWTLSLAYRHKRAVGWENKLII